MMFLERFEIMFDLRRGMFEEGWLMMGKMMFDES